MDNTAVDRDQLQKEISELEQCLRENPSDVETQFDLAWCLLSLYEIEPDSKQTLQRIEALLSHLPREGYEACTLRGCLAYIQKDYATSTQWHLEALKQPNRPRFELTRFEDLILDYGEIAPVDVWEHVAAICEADWGDTAQTRVAKGWALFYRTEYEQALDLFASALDAGTSAWLATWGCAEVYYQSQNWHAAVRYYRRALRAETARTIPSIWFNYAWSLGKTRDYQEEEKAYRACLELHPDYENARNNLGYSVYRQHRYLEALEIFNESIRRGNDGRLPLWNKARTLRKLGRYEEAIEVLQQVTDAKGNVLKSAQKEIADLNRLIRERSVTGLSPDQDPVHDERESDIEDQTVEGADEDDQPEATATVPGGSREETAIHAEQHLETFLEERIRRGQEVFGMRLRMYETDDVYGRQLPVPNGRLDLLTVDEESGDLVVIELKRGLGDDSVVGQTSRYMTWVRENLAADGQRVRAIICVHKASANLRLSAKAIPGLSVFEYDFYFRPVVNA